MTKSLSHWTTDTKGDANNWLCSQQWQETSLQLYWSCLTDVETKVTTIWRKWWVVYWLANDSTPDWNERKFRLSTCTESSHRVYLAEWLVREFWQCRTTVRCSARILLQTPLHHTVPTATPVFLAAEDQQGVQQTQTQEILIVMTYSNNLYGLFTVAEKLEAHKNFNTLLHLKKSI